MARWTTDFDCGFETNWWYVIKDTSFDMGRLKAKRRYEINKGIKNFEVKLITPTEYKESLYRVQVAAFSAYPAKYRPTVDKDSFIKNLDDWEGNVVFGAFDRKMGVLVGYALLGSQGTEKQDKKFIHFSILKTDPDFEKHGLNAALVEKILSYYSDFLNGGGIICDGARNISHETAFQDYLEKYFGFRKAYCKLHIRYNPKIKWIIKLLFPFAKVLRKFDGIGIVHKINGVMKMEKIYRSEK